jgi:hypothetical protein
MFARARAMPKWHGQCVVIVSVFSFLNFAPLPWSSCSSVSLVSIDLSPDRRQRGDAANGNATPWSVMSPPQRTKKKTAILPAMATAKNDPLILTGRDQQQAGAVMDLLERTQKMRGRPFSRRP